MLPNNLPNFDLFGYRVIRELGHNLNGGRVTYLAKDANSKLVVIKQFQFARAESNWLHYEEIEREIQILKTLDHPGIPKYLNSFQTIDGFCLVTEYINAHTLTERRSFTLVQVKQIALAALNILVYQLQQRYSKYWVEQYLLLRKGISNTFPKIDYLTNVLKQPVRSLSIYEVNGILAMP